MVNCGRKEAFEFIISNEELPNWLKAVGMFHSALNAEVKTGTYNHVGAKRKVNFDGGDSVLEELVSYNPYANYSYKVSEFTNSLRHMSSYAYGQLWFDRFGEQTRITWVYTIKPKNLIYRLILHLILPKKLKAYMQQSLINAKHYIENGD